MAWTIELHPEAASQLRLLAKRDRPTPKRVTDYLATLSTCEDPRDRGQGLSGPLAGLWRYRVGDWRIVADIHDERLVIVALDIDHRSRVYRD